MVMVNDDARIVDVNPAAAGIYGIDQQALLGRSITEFLPAEFDFEPSWQTFLTSESERDVVTIVGADGVEREIEYAATVDIVPGHHLIVGRDITDRVERERMLEETSQRLDAIVSTCPHPIFALDADDTIQLWNEAAQEAFGYTANAVEGAPVKSLELHTADQRSEFTTIFGRALGGETFTDLRLQRRTRAGDHLQLSLSTRPIRDDADRITGVVAVAKDITDYLGAEHPN